MKLLATLIAAGLILMGCNSANQAQPKADAVNAKPMAEKVAIAKVKPGQAATTQPTNNNVQGLVTFTMQSDGKVKVVAEVTGLAPNSKHGFHIHDKGDLSKPDLTSAGGHFNPDGHVHGGPTTSPVHAGDLGNLEADGDGNAKLELIVDDISIGSGEKNDIVGKSVIVHAKTDDFSTQPTGNSGARVAGGVIEKK